MPHRLLKVEAKRIPTQFSANVYHITTYKSGEYCENDTGTGWAQRSLKCKRERIYD
ncbi:unnamed protein product [Tenebrio molitor]|nr:unnamed protein product [Tenebrio molitor]